MSHTRRDLEQSRDEKDEKAAPSSSSSQTATETEIEITRRFISFDQNTHNSIVTNSVGMALLTLKKTYFGETVTETEVEAYYQEALKELEEQAKETEERTSYQSAVEHLTTVIKEPVDPQLDVVMLYLPTEIENKYKGTQYLFSLKETFTLVWKALQDHKKFTHAYTGTSEETLKQAKQDYSARLDTFFNVLKSMKSEKTCHHGNRNLLVFTLNGIYEGVSLIEESHLFVLAFLKENLNKLFEIAYKEIKKTEDKKALLEALWKWMSTQNPSKLSSIIDPKNEIITSLRKIILAHGSNPHTAKIDGLIQGAQDVLAFDCDPQKSPELYIINEILNFSETSLSERSAILLIVQKKVKKLYEEDAFGQQKEVLKNFSAIFKICQSVEKNRFLLTITSNITNEVSDVIKACEEYFEAFNKDKTVFPSVSADTLQKIKIVRERISKVDKDTMESQITNFFAQWFIALNLPIDDEELDEGTDEDTDEDTDDEDREDLEPDYDALKNLYSVLLNGTVRAKITLTDDIIRTFVSLDDCVNGEWNITPYQVNRFFLHAILIKPSEWSQTFADRLDQVIQFVENYFNDTSLNGVSKVLKERSYPRILLEQLRYLQTLHAGTSGVDRPDNMILLPEQIKNFFEWISVSMLLDDKKNKQVYVAYSAFLNVLFLEHVKKYDTFPDFSFIPIECRINSLRCIVQSKGFDRESFFSGYEIDNGRMKEIMFDLPRGEKIFIEVIQVFKMPALRFVLMSYPEKERFPFFKAIDKSICFQAVKDYVSPHQLKNFLKIFSEEDRLNLLKHMILSLGVKLSISNNEWVFIINELPEKDRLSCLTLLGFESDSKDRRASSGSSSSGSSALSAGFFGTGSTAQISQQSVSQKPTQKPS